MDFHSLTRKELQSLCKLNKIPANITNVAMADALQSLDIVEGIEEYLNVTQSETTDLAESTKTVEVSSPKAPKTRCRTTTRPKVKSTETENLPPTSTRTTRRGTNIKGVEEPKKDVLKTPAISSSRRKASPSSSCRNVSSQLNECEDEVTEASDVSPRKEYTELKKHTTRRSTRLTAKKSEELSVKKDSEKAIKIDSFSDERVEEVQENTVESGNTNVQVGDICDAFEKLDVLVVEEGDGSLVHEETVNVEAIHISEEEKDFGEIDQESDESSNLCEDGDFGEQQKNEEKFDTDEKDSPFEAKNLEQKNEEMFDTEEKDSPFEDENLEQKNEEKFDNEEKDSTFEDENLEQKLDSEEGECDVSEVIYEGNLSAFKEHNVVMVQEEQSHSLINNDTIFDSGVAQSDNIDVAAISFSIAADETTAMDVEVNEITVDETFNAMENLPTMTEEVPDLKPELYPENDINSKADADFDVATQGFENSSIEETNQYCAFAAPCLPVQNISVLTDVVGHPMRVTPIKKATPFKSLSIVSDDKENIDNGRKLQTVFVDEGMRSKKEKDEKEKKKKQMSLHEISMRQLRKQVKELTLKSISAKEDANKKDAATTRPALQALCENQLVGNETKN
ncbi:uncharacterized protein [Rutidosis leptorrhynchoides]|uniref:uncharacterized protein n=1 Tax=Rutidosis leptorrhynchoides TaxID=125765 RepID=UPI003A98D045